MSRGTRRRSLGPTRVVPVEHARWAGYDGGVNPLLAVGVLVVSVAVMVAIMLFARRHAPPGSRVGDSDRSSGVFGFLGAGFVILLYIVVKYSGLAGSVTSC